MVLFQPYDNININQLGETIPIWTDSWLDYSYKMLLKDTEFDGRDIIMDEPDYRHILKKVFVCSRRSRKIWKHMACKC